MNASTPVVVIGEPVTVRKDGALAPTESTDPVPADGLTYANPPLPSAAKYCPIVPGAINPVPPEVIGRAVPEYVKSSVPEVVIGAVTERKDGALAPTEVTVPDPPPPPLTVDQ